MILVVDRGETQAENLRSLIEFMDTPDVVTARPGEWRDRLGDAELEALFIGADVSPADVESLLGEVGDIDPNIPIVMLKGELPE